jgi:hypothetical protein
VCKIEREREREREKERERGNLNWQKNHQGKKEKKHNRQKIIEGYNEMVLSRG